ncbi:hypothetical protein ACFL59_16365 [Planctomycetota bacterium]
MLAKRLLLVLGMALVLVCTPAAAQGRKDADAQIRDLLARLNGRLNEQIAAADRLARHDVGDLAACGALDRLADILKEEANPRLQRAVAKTVGRVASKAEGNARRRTTDMLSDALRDDELHPVVRAEAVRAIGPLMPEDTVERRAAAAYLKKLLEDKNLDTALKTPAVSALTRWGYDVMSVVWGDLTSDDYSVRKTALSQIRATMLNAEEFTLEARRARELLAAIVNVEHSINVRKDLLDLVALAARRGSRVKGLQATIDQLVTKSDSPAMQLAAVRAIGSALDTGMIQLLVKVYGDGNTGDQETGVVLRAAACASAGGYFGPCAGGAGFGKHKLALSKLTAMLVAAVRNDSSNAVRTEAAFALGNMYSPKYDRREPVAALIETLASEDRNVPLACLDSLLFLTGQDFGTDLESWQTWFRKNRTRLQGK